MFQPLCPIRMNANLRGSTDSYSVGIVSVVAAGKALKKARASHLLLVGVALIVATGFPGSDGSVPRLIGYTGLMGGSHRNAADAAVLPQYRGTNAWSATSIWCTL